MEKIKLIVDFEADDQKALLEAVEAFAYELRHRGLSIETALSTAGWRYTSRQTPPG